ncbi:MAG: sigma-70 family RNA polymerase sigma factor [Planctomycetes bacterium]|nr:sigma-70 family RNA polymerase sigma factor [Planctomycetota bacterium]
MTEEAPEPSPPHDPTTAHVRAACKGSLASIHWLVERMTPALLSQARYHLRGLPEATDVCEDLTQDVWAVVLFRLSDLEPRDGRMTPVLSAFLTKTMRNRALNWLRRRATEARAGVPGGGVATASSLASSTLDVIHRLTRQEHVDLLNRALQQLDEEDREILILRGLEEHPYEDLTVLLRADVGALRMRFLRARARLKAILPESIFDELGSD